MRGFHVISNYLTETEVAAFARDYAASEVTDNNAYALGKVSPETLAGVKTKLQKLVHFTKTVGVFEPGHLGGGSYFATEKGIDFSWHQDHESLFIQQTHRDYLNIYIPVIKPNIHKSNLSLIPIDAWKAHAPEAWELLEWQGASSVRIANNKTYISNDHSGGNRVTLDFALDEIAETPPLNSGDALLLRGDMFHKTQDTQTRRVALSVRAWNNNLMVTQEHFLESCEAKDWYRDKNSSMYDTLKAIFQDHNQLTVGELMTKSIERR